jgi:hypothetical protein
MWIRAQSSAGYELNLPCGHVMKVTDRYSASSGNSIQSAKSTLETRESSPSLAMSQVAGPLKVAARGNLEPTPYSTSEILPKETRLPVAARYAVASLRRALSVAVVCSEYRNNLTIGRDYITLVFVQRNRCGLTQTPH